jgi:hypothetical protein
MMLRGGVLATSVTPLGTVSGDLVSYILGYGPLGIGVIVVAFLLYRGWQLNSPARLSAIREECRADLIKENARLIEEKQRAEEQRDDALRAASDQLLPLLLSFTSATNALLPLLQKMVAVTEAREGHRDRGGR